MKFMNDINILIPYRPKNPKSRLNNIFSLKQREKIS